MATHLGQSPALADQRKASGISLWSIESSTKIGVRFLEAIEAEDFDQLPGGVYTINYLRQYARATGLDEADLLRRYHDRVARLQVTQPALPASRLSGWLHCLFRAFLHRLPQPNESRSHT